LHIIPIMKTVTVEQTIGLLAKKHNFQAEQLALAEEEAEKKGQNLLETLMNSHGISSSSVALIEAELAELPAINLSELNFSADLFAGLPEYVFTKHQMLPLAKVGDCLTVAIGDVYDLLGVQALTQDTSFKIFPVVAPSVQVKEFLTTIKSDSTQGLAEIIQDVSNETVEFSSEQAERLSLDEMLEGAEQAPVIRVTNSIMVEAIRMGASDIHIEPMEDVIRIRYRKDGMLQQSASPPKNLQSAIISRLKIMSNLDISERRLPQDGRCKIKVLDKECDIRVSTLPTVFGEKVVMRILDQSALAPSIGSLGLKGKTLEDLNFALKQPYGLILVTGPTGSGKTTTLYSGLSEINIESTNIITVEDPVEYQLKGINQVQMHPDIGLTFATGLRSILRQDPDVVMVGEMRDGETAHIGVEAALTGHLVLSTLHTNDAAGAISRMLQMGVEPFLLASSLLLTQAQRLYRRLCPNCKKPLKLPEDILKRNSIDPEYFKGTEIYGAVGCSKCGGNGYSGRGAIMEIILVDDRIREGILAGVSGDEIKRLAAESGCETMRMAGLDRVKAGVTTIEEILRITSEV